MNRTFETDSATEGQGTRAPVIAIAGNPNCGKTTLFNLLTGARQKVGNWPGVTVEYRSGTAMIEGRKVSVIDLPGVYSLLGGGGADQDVARSYLVGNDADLVINIVDAANLERHLSMTFELMQTGRPMIVVMNMIDEAEAMGLLPNPEGLAEGARRAGHPDGGAHRTRPAALSSMPSSLPLPIRRAFTPMFSNRPSRIPCAP